MSNSQVVFNEISSTGSIYAVFKATEECECREENGLFNEPDPTHKDCFGTGYKRRVYFTPKLRSDYYGLTKSSNLETQSFEKIKDNVKTIYFPYSFTINYKDIICSLKLDKENNPIKPYSIEYVYKPVSVDVYVADGFKFYAVKVTKLQHVPFQAIIG
jgi:hypothetical protein